MLISAKEAREKIEGLETLQAREQYKDIEQRINKAIEEGKDMAYYYDYLLDPVENELKRLGYKYTYKHDPRDLSVCVIINW